MPISKPLTKCAAGKKIAGGRADEPSCQGYPIYILCAYS